MKNIRIIIMIILCSLENNISAETNALECSPGCTGISTCILVLLPTASDTINEGETLPVTSVVSVQNMDNIVVRLSVDSGKIYRVLGTKTFTVTACTTRISSLIAPNLNDLGIANSIKIIACKIKVSAYATSFPTGTSNGFFYIQRKAISVRYVKFPIKSNYSEPGNYTLYNIRGQKINKNIAYYNQVVLSNCGSGIVKTFKPVK